MEISGINSASSSIQKAMQTSGMTQETFLKLLVTELTNQSPLDPMDNKDFINQVTQFTMLEQTTTMSKNIDNIRTLEGWSYAANLVGKSVFGAGEDGPVSGNVLSVSLEDNQLWLVLENGDKLLLSNVMDIGPRIES